MTNIYLADEAWEEVEEGTEALVDQWLVAEGDQVSVGQIVAEVVLVKTTHEIAAPTAGVIRKICVDEQATFNSSAHLAELEEIA